MQTALELHPTYRNARFTLRGSFERESAANAKVESLREDGLEVLQFREESPDGRRPLFVAARHDVGVRRRATMPHRKDVPWRATAFSVALFRRIVRSSYGNAVRRWYKELEPGRIRRVYQELDWSGSNLDVASRLVPDLVLSHPFPNANHRTSIDIGRLYLTSVGIPWPFYELRGRTRRQRFYRDTKDFVFESKYLLQLFRHQEMVRVAMAHGYGQLKIGEEAFVQIREGDMGLAKARIRARHVAAARRLIKGLVDEAGEQELAQPRGRGLREWVDWVEAKAD